MAATTNVPGGYAKNDFYSEEDTTDDWVAVEFLNAVSGLNFVCGGIMLVCDSADAAFVSFDGVHTHGEIRANEALSFDNRNRERIYIKSVTPGSPATLRIFAW